MKIKPLIFTFILGLEGLYIYLKVQYRTGGPNSETKNNKGSLFAELVQCYGERGARTGGKEGGEWIDRWRVGGRKKREERGRRKEGEKGEREGRGGSEEEKGRRGREGRVEGRREGGGSDKGIRGGRRREKEEGRDGGGGREEKGGIGREDTPYTVSLHHLQVACHTALWVRQECRYTFDSVAVKPVYVMFDLLDVVFFIHAINTWAAMNVILY